MTRELYSRCLAGEVDLGEHDNVELVVVRRMGQIHVNTRGCVETPVMAMRSRASISNTCVHSITVGYWQWNPLS